MKIGLASYEFKNGDVSFNLRQMERAMAGAQGRADLLCFGEAFLQGFDGLIWQYDYDKNVAIAPDSPVMEQLKAMTVRYGVDLLFGYLERDGERIYSSCAVLQDGAWIHNYRRISPGWKEYDLTDDHYCEGEATAPFLYHGRTLQVALCGDLWAHPERFVTDGLLIWPVYLNFSLEDWAASEQEYAQHARHVAREALVVNPLSRDPRSHGGAFHFRDGEIVEKLPYDQEGILITEV